MKLTTEERKKVREDCHIVRYHATFDEVQIATEQALLNKLAGETDEEMVDAIAKTCYRFSHLIDDMRIDEKWSSSTDNETARFYECARYILSQIQPIIKAQVEKARREEVASIINSISQLAGHFMLCKAEGTERKPSDMIDALDAIVLYYRSKYGL